MIPAHSSAVSVPPAAPGASVKQLLPWLVAVAFFMESLDTTILNTAVPAIAKALTVAPLSMKAVLSSYTLRRFGYRRVLISNTMILGLLIVLFATIGVGTPVWLIVVQAFVFGFFTSLQYTSMNTLAYADVTEEQTSGASTIASTMQQMSISFGVATASLATAFFIPDRFHSSAPEMIHGIHQAFLVLGGLTVFSAIVFRELKNDDGDIVSQHNVVQHAG
jgi:MFS family permease